MELIRYSRIETGLRREFVLLQGTGCRWARCRFCDYHLDRSEDPYELNRAVLDRVTGEFGVVDIINSGSCMELDDRTIFYIKDMVKRLNIHTLWFEAHWMYHSRLKKFASQFECDVKFRAGVESFSYEIRKPWDKGIPENVTPEDIRRYFDGICLLVGTKGESRESIMNDIDTAERLFDYYSVNLFNPNTTDMELDEDLALFVRTYVKDYLKDSTKAELLIENTDLGVG